MSQDQLWAPWRLGYITGDKRTPERREPAQLAWLPGADRECFLCVAAAERRDRENLVVRRSSRCLTIINRYPYNNGHLLVAPLEHRARLEQLDAPTHAEITAAIVRHVGQLEQRMNAEGFNIGINLGRVAGAGVPGHLHWHIVPRWSGDTNFMPVLAGVDVIPQALDALWQVLVEAERTTPEERDPA